MASVSIYFSLRFPPSLKGFSKHANLHLGKQLCKEQEHLTEIYINTPVYQKIIHNDIYKIHPHAFAVFCISDPYELGKLCRYSSGPLPGG